MEVFPIPPAPMSAIGEVLGKTNDLLDQFATFETCPWCRGWKQLHVYLPQVQSGRRGPHGNDETHVEDVKDPVEVRLPGDNLFLVVHCMEMLGNHISFALLDDLLIDHGHSSEVRPKAS